MTDSIPPQSSPATATGGCALGCGSLFLIAGAAFLVLLMAARHYKPETVMVPLLVGGPAFLLGHILAIVAIQSKSVDAQQNGKRALWLMWSGLVVFAAVYLVFPPSAP